MDKTINQLQTVNDGHVVIILRLLRDHYVLSDARLNSLVKNEFETSEQYQATKTYIRNKGWVVQTGSLLKMSMTGSVWLEENVGSLAVEEEDSSSDDIPTHPYEVAKLKMETKHLSVFQALRKIEKDEINISPDFQRAFVWDETKQSRLIESILIRIPLPAFYLDASDQVHWSVVDGLQRLNTLYNFCRKQTFVLKNMQFLVDLNGKKFDDLPPQYKVLIEDDTQLLFYNLMPGTPVEAKFTIFSRVNTGGMQLTPQEIRHALSQGKSTPFLAELAHSKEFVGATLGVVNSKRMADRELVLRALAFMSQGIEVYKEFGELDAFLLHTMAELNLMPDQELVRLKNDFFESLVKVTTVFGRYSFRKFSEKWGRRSPLNKALFEVWVYNVRNYDLEYLQEHKESIIDGFIELVCEDDRFLKSVSASTGSYSSVSTRFSRIEDLLIQVG